MLAALGFLLLGNVLVHLEALGLAETALEVLEKAKELDLVEGSIAVGLVLRIELMLDMGRLEQARTLLAQLSEELKANTKSTLGMLYETNLWAHDWLRLRVSWASGDYEEADEVLREVLEDFAKRADQQTAVESTEQLFRGMIFNLIPDAMPVSGLGALSLPVRMPLLQMVLVSVERQTAANRNARECDLLTLRAWLALERGATKDARRHLEVALKKLGDIPAFRFRGPLLADVGMAWLLAGGT